MRLLLGLLRPSISFIVCQCQPLECHSLSVTVIYLNLIRFCYCHYHILEYVLDPIAISLNVLFFVCNCHLLEYLS